MKRTPAQKHYDANRKCNDPFGIHIDKRRRYKVDYTVSPQYAERLQDFGLYTGQKLCGRCRKTATAKWKELEKTSPQLEQEQDKDESRIIREKSPCEPENTEFEVQFIHEKLKDITNQLRELKLTGSKISYHTDSRITTEVMSPCNWEYPNTSNLFYRHNAESMTGFCPKSL